MGVLGTAAPAWHLLDRARPGGALLLTVGIVAVQVVTDVYFAGRLGRVSDLDGSLGIATVFLAWLYVSSRLIVAAATLNATMWKSHHPRASRMHGQPPRAPSPT